MVNKVYVLMEADWIDYYSEGGDPELEYVKCIFSNLSAAIETLNSEFQRVCIPNEGKKATKVSEAARGKIYERYYEVNDESWRFWIEEWMVKDDPVYIKGEVEE